MSPAHTAHSLCLSTSHPEPTAGVEKSLPEARECFCELRELTEERVCGARGGSDYCRHAVRSHKALNLLPCEH